MFKCFMCVLSLLGNVGESFFAGTRVRIGEARDRDVEVFDVKGREEEHDHAGDHVEVDHAGDIAVDPVATRDELEATLEERE